jgi:hypothetical protein
MNRSCTSSLVLILVAVSGCGSPAPKSGAPGALALAVEEGEGSRPEDWAYAHAELKEQLLALTAATHRFRASDWHYDPWQVRSRNPGGSPSECRAFWASKADAKPYQDWTVRPLISVLATARPAFAPPHEGSNQIGRLGYTAQWFPDADGWGAALHYENHRPNRKGHADTKTFTLTFYHPKHGDGATGVVLTVPDGGYRTRKTFSAADKRPPFGGLEYDIASYLYASRLYRGVSPPTKSAESMRDAGLAALEQLEAVVREEVASGQAVREVYDYDNANPRNKEAATYRPPIPAKFQLSADQKQEVLQEALKEIERRRTLLREHHTEMYDAAKNLFPLIEGLKEP